MPLAPRRPALAPHGAVAGAATLVSAAIIVAALWLAQDVLVPLVLAGLLAFVLAPVARGLQRAGLPWGLAVPLTVLGAVAATAAVAYAIGLQAAALAEDLPRLAAALRERLGALSGLGDLLRQADALLRGDAAPAAPSLVPAPAAPRPEASTFELARTLLGPVLHPLATAALVAFFATLILLFRSDLRDRVIRLAGARDLHRTMSAMNDAAARLSRLFLAQVALNGAFAAAVTAGLWLAGLPSPLLWGILAGLMRFVPFIGTPIALTPPVVLALAMDPGWVFPVAILLVMLLGEAFMGQVAEPLVFGRRTGLSPLSIILSASFWTMLWGPIGLLIATPLTVGLVVLGRHVPQLEFLDVVLGDRPALAPAESFYQRAMEGDADGLVSQARAVLAEEEASAAAWGDGVALRGLVLAQADWSREAFEPDRLEVIRAAAGTALDELAETLPPAPAHAGAWAAEGAVLCLPARGALDDLAARVAALALRQGGFGAEAAPAGALDAANLERLGAARVRLCVLSVLEEGNSVAGVRTYLRRLARQLPEARVIVGLWRAPPDSPMLAALREEGPAEAIVTTSSEAVALCEALAGRARATA